MRKRIYPVADSLLTIATGQSLASAQNVFVLVRVAKAAVVLTQGQLAIYLGKPDRR